MGNDKDRGKDAAQTVNWDEIYTVLGDDVSEWNWNWIKWMLEARQNGED